MVVGVGRIGADGRGDHLARVHGRAVLGGDDGDVVVLAGLVRGALWLERIARAAHDHRVEAADPQQLLPPLVHEPGFVAAFQGQPVDRLLGDYDEQGEVDRVDALANNGPLAAPLPAEPQRVVAPGQKRPGVLEVVARNDPREGLLWLQRLAVACEDVADLPLGDHGQSGSLWIRYCHIQRKKWKPPRRTADW